MQTLGEALRRAYPEIQPSFDPAHLMGLPPTVQLEVQLELGERELAEHVTTNTVPRRLEQSVARLRRAVTAARERDRLQAERPAGCWCLGLGGRGERFAIRPDAVGEDVGFLGSEGKRIYSDEEYASFLDEHCGCPEGHARKARDEALRTELRELAIHQQQTRDVERLWSGAEIPERFKSCSLDTYPVTPATRGALEVARKFLPSTAWCQVFLGDYGVGKSGLCLGILRAGAEQHLAGLFVKVPDLLGRIKATYSKASEATESEVLASLRTVPVLGLDDLGAEHGSEKWVTSLLFQVLDYRHDQLLKTVITTNLSINELRDHLGVRNMERFREGTRFCQVVGPNLRARKDLAAA